MSVALNAAAYYSPACGHNGYFKNYFKVLKFWIIPFCVSSISVACNSSPNECILLFPINDFLLIIHLSGMSGIILIGMTINTCILPKCKQIMDEEEELDEEECGGNRNTVKRMNGTALSDLELGIKPNGSLNAKQLRFTRKNGKEINGHNHRLSTLKRKGSVKMKTGSNNLEESREYDAIPLSHEEIDGDNHK